MNKLTIGIVLILIALLIIFGIVFIGIFNVGKAVLAP